MARYSDPALSRLWSRPCDRTTSLHRDNDPPDHSLILHTWTTSAGAKLFFLPAYSPDLNPIERVFAKLKHLLGKAVERSKEAVWRKIGTLLDQFTPQECENHLRNSGYGSV